MNVAIIPARGGSKGIPGKNLHAFGAKPLIAWTIGAALSAPGVDRVIISTDSPEIARVAEEYGASVPFLRPPELATDDTPMIEVLRHAVGWMQGSGWEVEAVTLLQPTSPLRTAAHISSAWRLFQNSPQGQSLVSVVAIPHQFHPASILSLQGGMLVPALPDAQRSTRRQDKPVLYARNGPAILILKPVHILAGQLYADPCVAYIMDEDSSIDIDSLRDLEIAAQRLHV
jgi:CMP-N-acetylneuraminic acid synthetase